MVEMSLSVEDPEEENLFLHNCILCGGGDFAIDISRC